MDNIGLLAVDSSYPNLALMKISSYHKARGDTVDWYNPFNPGDPMAIDSNTRPTRAGSNPYTEGCRPCLSIPLCVYSFSCDKQFTNRVH